MYLYMGETSIYVIISVDISAKNVVNSLHTMLAILETQIIIVFCDSIFLYRSKSDSQWDSLTKCHYWFKKLLGTVMSKCMANYAASLAISE